MDEIKTLGDAIQMANINEDCTTYILLAFDIHGQAAFVAGGDLHTLTVGAEIIAKRINDAQKKYQN